MDLELVADCDSAAVLAALSDLFVPTVTVTATHFSRQLAFVRVTVDAPGNRELVDRLQAVPGVHAVHRVYDAAPCVCNLTNQL